MNRFPSSFRKAIPFLAFAFFSAMALLLWREQVNHQRELMLRHTDTTAHQAKIRIEGLMKARMASLDLLKDRWVERKPPDFSQERFLSFAAALFRHYPGFTAINWISPDGVIRWVFPEDANSALTGQSVYQHADGRYRTALKQALESRSPVMTPCIELRQGGTGFDIVIPLIYEGSTQGYLDAVFSIEAIVNVSLSRGIFDDFLVSIYEDGNRIYFSGDADESAATGNGFYAEQRIRFGSKEWQLILQPASDLYSSISAAISPLLVFGLALSLALATLLHLLLRRMELYRHSRDQALREVEERKRVEATLRENEQKLEQLLGELSVKNEEMEAFVYTVSHDLKTPIVTIEGFIGALREDYGSSLDTEGARYLKYMSDAARKMEALIDDLLELSRIGRVAEKKSEFPLADLVKSSLKDLRPLIEARGIAIRVQEQLPIICGEKKRLGQVMDNLLANAVKYMDSNKSTPTIEVGTRKQNGRDVFFVRDNGIGIEQRYFDKVFQIFERLPSAKRAGEGTGIGLTIVKRIIEHHGGRIWIDSEAGKGTTFYFTLGES